MDESIARWIGSRNDAAIDAPAPVAKKMINAVNFWLEPPTPLWHVASFAEERGDAMKQLSAEARVENDAIMSVMEKLRDEHAEFQVDTGVEGQLEFRTHYGSVRAILGERQVLIRVFAEDETCLSYMKMTVAGHLAEHLGTTNGMRWQGDGSDAGLPAFFREITVASSERITPHMQRVRFAATDIGRFARGGLHVRLLLPPRGRSPVWPTLGVDGLMVWPSGEDALVVRVYTIRAIDVARSFFDIDFVLHEGDETPAATFAQTARPGDVIGMIGPGGGGVPEAKSLLLVGDDTALPAIARILEQLPPSSSAEVLLEIDGPADAVPPAEHRNVRVTWLYREGRAPGTAGLLPAALRKIDPATLPDGFHVWAGCEFADFREIRGLVRKQWGLKRDRHLVVAYWRRGVAGESDDE
jgi:NADPH-dependent ferric siderophore reductase